MNSIEQTIHDLMEQNEKLKRENQLLKSELKKRGIILSLPEQKLDKQDKIHIFMNYFNGRKDVFEKIYYNQKTQKLGWSIACDIEFKPGCRKGKIKNPCTNCPVAQYTHLDEDIIEDHFLGRNKGIGIFPLLQDDTCNFLAFDFDDDSWFEDMYSVYKAAIQFDLYPVMERSASGNGGHLWFFFAEPLKASLARRFGEWILQETMKTNTHLKYSSFDRMFPNQDYLPEGGFGNQIALPLRYAAYKKGNSTFINDLKQPLQNPIEHLSSRKKSTREEIETLITNYKEPDYFFDQEQLRFNLDSTSEYSKNIIGFELSIIAIEKKNLNSLTYNALKRVASMYNPRYYELQRLHKPIYYATTPRVLSFYEEDDQHLYLPRGLKDRIQEVLPDTKIDLKDKRCSGMSIDVEFLGELRKEQENAISKLINHETGVLKAVPGFGKTVIGIYLISYFKVNTLIIVPSKQIQDQWLERFQQFLKFPNAEKKKDRFICTYNGTQKRLNHNIDIATAASLANAENLTELLSGYGMVIIDECHHAASNTFTHILRHVLSKRIYGLSATPKRKDGLEKIIYMFCGKLRYGSVINQGKQHHEFMQLLIPRMTNSIVLKENTSYTEICKELIHDTARNYLILKDILSEYKQQGKIIVLSERKEHLYILKEMLEKAAENVFLLTGNTKKADRNNTFQKINSFSSNQPFILLATSKLLGEGFDLPSLKTLFLLLPISDENRITQYTGRIHRPDKGKSIVKVYDYVDTQIAMMQSMFYKRLKQYQREGYHVQERDSNPLVNQILFENNAFENILKADIQNAKKEIVIFSTHIKLTKIKNLYDELKNKFTQGIYILFILSDNTKENKEELHYLKGLGAQYRFMKHYKHFIIIDRSIVWHLNYDWFGYTKPEQYAIRMNNAHLIQEILTGYINEDKTDELKLF